VALEPILIPRRGGEQTMRATQVTAYFAQPAVLFQSLQSDPAHFHRWAINRTSLKMDQEVNVLALVKGEEKFIFLFDDENRDETLRQLARFAADPELDFSWYDAAMLSRKIRDAVPSDDDLFANDEFDSLSIDDFH
jgi:hypothetical protein